MPAIPKKETSRLKKTTGNVAGATKAAAPVVPPPTIRAQPVSQPPSTIAAAAPVPAAAAPTSAATAVSRPTVKLQTADIPKIPSPPAAAPASSSSQPAPVMVEQSGPAMLDVILSVLVMVFSGVSTYLLFMVHGS